MLFAGQLIDQGSAPNLELTRIEADWGSAHDLRRSLIEADRGSAYNLEQTRIVAVRGSAHNLEQIRTGARTYVCQQQLVSYSSKQALRSLYMPTYFYHNLKPTRCLQFYYTPNDYSVTEDALLL